MTTPAPLAAPSDDALDPDARLVLVGKPGCHLCDDARVVVERVCGELGVRWQERSTLEDITLEMAYWEYIPVVFVDGREHARWFVDEAVLREALARS